MLSQEHIKNGMRKSGMESGGQKLATRESGIPQAEGEVFLKMYSSLEVHVPWILSQQKNQHYDDVAQNEEELQSVCSGETK
jgi:hypothetical protein